MLSRSPPAASRPEARPPRVGRETAALAAFVLAAMLGLTAWLHAVHSTSPLIIDEVLYSWQARLLAGGKLTDPVPAHQAHVQAPYLLIRNGRRFGQYPAGFPLALAPWLMAGIPWGLNIALAGASIVLLHGFIRRIDGPGPAWIGACLLALSPFFIAQSTLTFSHPLILFLTILVLVAIERREPSARKKLWAIVAGSSIAYLVNVSPFAAAPPVMVAVLRSRIPPRWTPGEIAAFSVPIFAGALAFFAVNFATTGDAFLPAYYAGGEEVRAGMGKFAGEKGHTLRSAVENTADEFALLDRFLFGWSVSSLLPALIVLGVWFFRFLPALGRRRRDGPRPGPAPPRRDDWLPEMLLLVAGTAVVYAFWYFPGTGTTWGPRYLYGTLPAFVLLSARALYSTRRAFVAAFRNAGFARRAAPLLPALLVAALTLTGTVPFLSRLAEQPILQWRRATGQLRDEIARRGLRRGTILIVAQDGLAGNYLPALLGMSGFSDNAPLVFIRSRSSIENRIFLALRGDAPVLYVWAERDPVRWRLEEDPPAPPSGAPRPRRSEEERKRAGPRFPW